MISWGVNTQQVHASLALAHVAQTAVARLNFPMCFPLCFLHPALLRSCLCAQALAWIYDKELVANLFSGAAGELGGGGH